MGGEGRFKQVLAVGAHTLFVMIGVGALVALPLILHKQSAMEVTFSPAIFVDAEFTSPTYRLLSSLDAFWIWGAALAGLGLSVVSKISKGAGLTVSFAIYVVLVALRYVVSGLNA